MGRRKIEIKAIKDDRNRSVTFLKRKGGLFKKAHELSVLCSVDVAVFIFGNNKKLYEYSSADMRDLITRYQYHGVPNEHKGPSDFQSGNDEDDDEDAEGTPPRGHDGLPPDMARPFPFPGMPRDSPPITNGVPHGVMNGVPYQPHPGHVVPRNHTPQPNISRPGSRNDMPRMGPGMPVGPPGPHHPGPGYMPPYNSSGPPQTGPMAQPPAGYAPFPPPPQSHPHSQPHQHPHSHPHPHPPPHPHQLPPQHHQPHPHPHPHPPQPPYMEDRHRPPPFPAPVGPPNVSVTRAESSPPHPSHQPIPHPVPHMSPPPPQPQPDRRPQDPQPPPPPKDMRSEERPPQPYLSTDGPIRKMPRSKGHSIFTPIEENRSILSQHLASFEAEPLAVKPEANGINGHRAQSADPAAASRNGSTVSPPRGHRTSPPSNLSKVRNMSESSSVPETAGFTPPSRSNSLKSGGGPRPRGPRLTVQIPDEVSEPGSATAEGASPRNQGEAVAPMPQRLSHPASGVVLPPPSPSASALLSAGATGPPNPFARPPPQQSINMETPASALPSRFLSGSEFLASPSAFYSDWNFRGDGNTLPSPLNFATPVAGSGPSFLNDGHSSGIAANSSNPSAAKRKSPDYGAAETEASDGDPKRVKVE